MRIIPLGRLMAAAVGSLLLWHMPATAKNPMSFSISDMTVTESSGAVDYRAFATFRIRISGPMLPGVTYTATCSTSPGTATAGSDCVGETDFATNSGTVTFSLGQTERTFSVLVCPDYRAEPNETFTLNLTYGTAPFNTSARAQCTIIDNDSPEVTVGDITASEGDTNGWHTFPVTLSRSSSQDVVCEYGVISRSGVDTATNGSGSCNGSSDYAAFPAPLTIRAGQTSGTISVTICGDNTREPAETFRVVIVRASNATIRDGEAVCTIRDDD